jgi:mRNA interferase RelE/StbE
MIVEFDKSFDKSLDKIKEASVFQKLETILEQLEKANNLNEINNVRKLSGFKEFYRIRIGDYRLGFEMIKPGFIRIIIIAHRNSIYTRFPKK